MTRRLVETEIALRPQDMISVRDDLRRRYTADHPDHHSVIAVLACGICARYLWEHQARLRRRDALPPPADSRPAGRARETVPA